MSCFQSLINQILILYFILGLGPIQAQPTVFFVLLPPICPARLTLESVGSCSTMIVVLDFFLTNCWLCAVFLFIPLNVLGCLKLAVNLFPLFLIPAWSSLSWLKPNLAATVGCSSSIHCPLVLCRPTLFDDLIIEFVYQLIASIFQFQLSYICYPFAVSLSTVRPNVLAIAFLSVSLAV